MLFYTDQNITRRCKREEVTDPNQKGDAKVTDNPFDRPSLIYKEVLHCLTCRVGPTINRLTNNWCQRNQLESNDVHHMSKERNMKVVCHLVLVTRPSIAFIRLNSHTASFSVRRPLTSMEESRDRVP